MTLKIKSKFIRERHLQDSLLTPPPHPAPSHLYVWDKWFFLLRTFPFSLALYNFYLSLVSLPKSQFPKVGPPSALILHPALGRR